VGVGLVALLRFLPGSLAAPFIALLIDRVSRRTVLLGSSIASFTVLTGAATAAALHAPAWVVFAFPALFAVASCGYGPAHAALTPALAETPQQLSASNVTHSAMEYTGSLLAALAAGVLLGSTTPSFVFGVAAASSAAVVVLVSQVKRDSRPRYHDEDEEVGGVLRELTVGMRTLAEHPALRLASATLVLLGSVGFLNAAWGIGALIGAMSLARLLDRGRLVVAIARGSLLLGLATMLPGISPEPVLAYAGWLGIGIGFVFVEVGAKTLTQRLGSDETLGRMIGSLESARQAAMALGSIGAIVCVEVLGVREALIALGALMPVFVVFWWTRLRAYEVGAPVAERPFQLLRNSPIFAPLPVATLERLSHDLVPVEVPAKQDVIVQGESGDLFFLVDKGEVEVFENGAFRRTEGPGECFGEIALLHDTVRTATVRTTVPTRLLALDRDQFLLAVTGHRRSHQRAHAVVDERWQAAEVTVSAPD
jgi:MFS family permease